MPTLQQLSGTDGPRRLRTAGADAVGLILLIDAALSLAPGHCSIGPVFFHLPAWVPAGRLWPAVFGAGILLRFRPVIAAAIAVALWNALDYAVLVEAGAIRGLPFCFSAIIALGMMPALRQRRVARPAAVGCAAGGLLLAHLFTFGCTDYRRPADGIVVFGARVYADGTPSEALADRVRTGIDLYQQGYAGKLIFSGGGAEPQAMKRMALAAGVPEEAIVLDDRGLNTAATVRNLRGRFARVLAVSHYYHNARIKLTGRRFGVECATVPAKMTRRLAAEPRYIARECAAFAAYYLRLR